MLTTMILPFILLSLASSLEAVNNGSVPKAQVMLQLRETDSSHPAAESCLDLQTTGGKSGVYSIQLPETREKLRVWCDMDSGNGGWLVFQRRRDGSVDFYRNWTQYEQGFGDVSGEFWLGLSRLHTLTKGRPTRLRVDLGEVGGHRHYAEYSSFTVDGPETNYRLTVAFYSGNAGDSLHNHNNQSFSTFDRDNDEAYFNCAAVLPGAWWYKDCYKSNLNGRYQADPGSHDLGIHWLHAHHDWRSFTFSEMKVQPCVKSPCLLYYQRSHPQSTVHHT